LDRPETEPEGITGYVHSSPPLPASAEDLGSVGAALWLWHQDLREGSALEAFFFDDVQLQMRS
jgi:hypothetical protein